MTTEELTSSGHGCATNNEETLQSKANVLQHKALNELSDFMMNEKIAAIAVGDIHNRHMVDFLSSYERCGCDDTLFLKNAFRMLVDQKTITMTETKALEKLADIIGPDDVDIDLDGMRQIRADLINADSSAASITIASVAVSSSELALQQITSDPATNTEARRRWRGIVRGDVRGGVFGLIVTGGRIAGGLIGAIAASLIVATRSN